MFVLLFCFVILFNVFLSALYYFFRDHVLGTLFQTVLNVTLTLSTFGRHLKHCYFSFY